jgi:hypothetical protein
MYHTTDDHLYIPVAWDSDNSQACSFELVCQNCHTKEIVVPALQTAVDLLLVDNPEFEEEHTTGWDMIQTIRNFIAGLN